MTYMQRLIEIDAVSDANSGATMLPRSPLLLIIEDDERTAHWLQPICDFLEIGVERIASERDVTDALHEHRPMAVVAQMDCQGQDGCHVMMTVAQYDRSLPILLIVGPDPALAGAADAVEELWQLESVTKLPGYPGVGAIVDFVFHAGRKGRCIRLMPI